MARRKKIQYPAKGKIRATGDPVTLIGECVEAGIPCYRVVFEGSGSPVKWAQTKVVVSRAS